LVGLSKGLIFDVIAFNKTASLKLAVLFVTNHCIKGLLSGVLIEKGVK